MDASPFDASFDAMVSDAGSDTRPLDAAVEPDADTNDAGIATDADIATDAAPEVTDATIEEVCVEPTDCDVRDTVVCFGANLLERDYTCVDGECVEERTTTSCFFTRDACSLDGSSREVTSGFCNAAAPACEERVNVMPCSSGCDSDTSMCRTSE